MSRPSVLYKAVFRCGEARIRELNGFMILRRPSKTTFTTTSPARLEKQKAIGAPVAANAIASDGTFKQ